MSLQLNISYRQIFKIALPISFAILIPQLNFFINTFFIAQIGTHELGDAGITGVYYLVFSSIGYGLNNGLQSLISRKAGENAVTDIGKLFNQGIIIALSIAFAAILFTYTLLPYVLNLFLSDSKAVDSIVGFLKIRIWGLPFLYMFQMRNALLVGINQSKYLPIGTAAETVVNILLDYTLIFGVWGMPQLGFNGAAYASVIADFTGMIVTYFIAFKLGVDQKFGILKSFKIEKKRIKEILHQSGPLIFQHAISIISWLLFFLLIGRMVMAETNLAISNTMRNVFGLFGVVTWALGSTTNTMVSNIIGQGKKNLLPVLLKKLLTVSIGFSLFFCLILNLFPGVIFQFFSKEASVINEAIPVIRVISFATILMSMSVVLLNTVIGSGNARISLYIEIITIVFYTFYTIVATELYKVSLTIAWMNEWIYWLCLGGFSFLFLRKYFKTEKIAID